MRAGRVLAVAWRDLRVLGSGRGAWRLPALALGLLLPVGAIPLPSRALPVQEATAAGQIPPALVGRIRPAPVQLVTLEGQDPVRVRGARIPAALRAALDTLPGEPRVRWELRTARPPVPRRSLLVALVGVSLLTGPLAETLPGERSRNTLIALLSAAISRRELVLGKWLAWTGSSTATMALVALSGALSGVQPLGWWVLGLPGAAGCVVALGLWLGAGARDAVDGAARAMRALPVAAMVAGVAAWALCWQTPNLGAWVPLGGALMVAGGVAEGPGAALAALLSAGALCAGLVAWTARRLDELDEPVPPRAQRELGVLATGALLWWLPVVGPTVWGAAGNADLGATLPAGAQLGAGGALLGLYAAVEALRRHWPPALGLERGAAGVPRGLAVGAAMGLADGVAALQLRLGPAWAQEAALRLGAGLAPGWAGLGAALAVAVGQELFFRGLLRRALGPGGAALAWVLLCCPTDPARGLLSALVLEGLARRYGLGACVAARLGWALLPMAWSLPGLGVSLAVWALALAAAWLGPERPVRLRFSAG